MKYAETMSIERPRDEVFALMLKLIARLAPEMSCKQTRKKMMAFNEFAPVR